MNLWDLLVTLAIVLLGMAIVYCVVQCFLWLCVIALCVWALDRLA